jgi:hypothetical protein
MNRPRKPVQINPGLSLLLLPALFFAGAISIPYSLVANRIRRNRSDAFLGLMRSKGRVIQWEEFLERIDAHEGTVIEERDLPKLSLRWWWTPEGVQRLSPHPISDARTMWIDRNHDLFSHWCHDRYTNADTGKALLVSWQGAKRGEEFRLWERLQNSSENWIAVASPEVLLQRRRKSSRI